MRAKSAQWLLLLLCWAPVSHSEVLRDPTRPVDYQGAEMVVSQDWQVSMILGNRDGKQALINDSFVKEGDTIDGYRVVKIREDRVELHGEREDITLKLNDDMPGLDRFTIKPVKE